jgi:hypothetical protein
MNAAARLSLPVPVPTFKQMELDATGQRVILIQQWIFSTSVCILDFMYIVFNKNLIIHQLFHYFSIQLFVFCIMCSLFLFRIWYSVFEYMETSSVQVLYLLSFMLLNGKDAAIGLRMIWVKLLYCHLSCCQPSASQT